MRVLVLTSCAGCVWVGDDELRERLDRDLDGIPGEVDCNDDRRSVSELGAWDGALSCGELVVADVYDGQDRLEFVNCVHPFDHQDLVELGDREQIWELRSPVPVDVEVRLQSDAFWLNLGDSDTDDIALVAFRGATCAIDTCVVGLPLAEEPRPADHPGFSPAVRFHADAEEAWFVVVSGGCRANTRDLQLGEELKKECASVAASPYELTISCAE